MGERGRDDGGAIPGLGSFLASLPELADQDSLARAVAAFSEPYGLPTVMAGAAYVNGPTTRARFYFGNWPPEWMARYDAEVLASDPLVGEARRRMTPFTWRELQAGGDLSPSMRAAFAAGRAAGWSDGFAVPIHGPSGYTALVSFAGVDLRLSLRDRIALRAVALAAHDRSREIAEAADRPGRTLTVRENEVMRWVAAGKTDREVGRLLGITTRTAHFHVEQVKEKLGARTRGEAISLLVMDSTLFDRRDGAA